MVFKTNFVIEIKLFGKNIVLESDYSDYSTDSVIPTNVLFFSGRTVNLNLPLSEVLKGLLNLFFKDTKVPPEFSGFFSNIVIEDVYVSIKSVKENDENDENDSRKYSFNFIGQINIYGIKANFVFNLSDTNDYAFGILFSLGEDDWKKYTSDQKFKNIEIESAGFIYASKKGSYTLPVLVKGKDNESTLKLSGLKIELKEGLNYPLFNLNGKRLEIDTSKQDGFIKKVAPPINVGNTFRIGELDIPEKSPSFEDGMLQYPIQTNWVLGPVHITTLYILLGYLEKQSGKPSFNFGAAIDLKASLSVLKIFIEEFGILLNIDEINNKPPFGFSFKPPTGVALAVNTEGVVGSGFLKINTKSGEYRGGLVLSFKNLFTFRAIAIINTKLPGGQEGFSLFVMITGEFQPVQLGFGFTLNGVGGLFGYNRTVEVDKLNEMVRSGQAALLLFPPPSADLPTIVNTAAEVYPVKVGNFVFGPMGKIGWGTPTIISAEIALIVEVPDPVRIGMMGVIRVVLPDPELPTIRLNMVFFGLLDFAKKEFSLQASLFESSILTMALSGDFAMIIAWGQQPMFILSAGGFHPAFKEAPPRLASMRRLALTLIDQENLKIGATTYLAITSNTAQFGAHVGLWGKFGLFEVNGQFWFDVLFQFNPFRFQAEMGLVADIKWEGNSLAAVSIVGRIHGPGPWHVQGEATLKIWVFEEKLEIDHTWGEEPPALAPVTVDVRQQLEGEVQKKENWQSTPVPGTALSGISVRDLGKEPDIVLMPNCLLTFRQKLVPLGIEIQKFGEAVPIPKAGENKFDITIETGSKPAYERFARANFFYLSDEDKLSYPSFEEFAGGATFEMNNSGLQKGTEVKDSYDYELKYLSSKKEVVPPDAFNTISLKEFRAGSAYQSVLSLEQNRPGLEAITPILPTEQFAVVRRDTLQKLGNERHVYRNFTEAEQFLKAQFPNGVENQQYIVISALDL